MTQCFSEKDIDKWAFFSGDYNQVHFDEVIARKNGLNGIIVQGMLYLQHAKLALSHDLFFPARMKFRLKKPIYKNTVVNYSINNLSHLKKIKINNFENQCCVVGHAGEDEKTAEIKRASNEIIIDSLFITKQLDLYKKTYPEITTPWLIMDALLFSVCFKFQEGDPFYKKALKISKEPDKSKIVTFQVDQDIFISEHAFPTQPEDMQHLRFYYEDQDMIKEDYSVYSILKYQVYHNDRLLYQSTMGSITRAFEAQHHALIKDNAYAK